MYVDDESALLDLTRIYLEGSGEFKVDTVLSVHDATEALMRESYDVVVSDYQMPDMDGVVFLKQLRHQGNPIPFIIFTGRGEENVVIEALNAGADFYVQKGEDPKVQFADLGNKIRQAVRRSTAERSLRESEERFRNVVEDQTEIISRFRPDGVFLFVNDAFCRYFNVQQEYILGRRFEMQVPSEDYALVESHLRSLTREHPVATIEHRIIMPDGFHRWQQRNDRAIFDDTGTLVEYQSVGRDITDLKCAEEALKTSLEEKNMLLREIHHRVKNNMQVVIGLLQFQASTVSSPEIARIVLDTETRIRSMVLIHEMLYNSDDFINIPLESYIRDLIDSLIYTYRTKTFIDVEYNIEKIQIDQPMLIHLGLLITEVVSNSLKHAFPDRETGTISLSFYRKECNNLTLSIHDDGIGIPDSCLRQKPVTMGLQLIYLLGRDQLNGTILIEGNNGTTFTFTFNPALHEEV
ncbi:sensor histidine kinase [Methanoregula sp.]|uniref:sensor histidine kinase n=1 Tax=Methanoregula sp. TaxID=2052170 RepID=UPI002B72908E|nr:histidine kinase dimerization/phosphoacceptor domain -containing protein [Methanoregula sp.]HVP96091.1 histidine kinase dimerization/phosphoacceptor domain -containing protein [Methanoregula sp.]